MIYVIEQEQILIHVQFLNAIITVIAFFFEVIAKQFWPIPLRRILFWGWNSQIHQALKIIL